MAKKPTAAKTAAVNPAAGVNETTEATSAVGQGDESFETVKPEDQAIASAVPVAAPDAKIPLAKMRGPRGVPETALIMLLAGTNPKRPNSKAHAAFARYVTGMTVGAFCDAVDALSVDGKSQKGMGTPHLVYDTKHGFISIEGYTVPGGVETPKAKAPPKPKAEKTAKPKAEKVDSPVAAEAAAAVTSANAAAVEAAVEEEVLE